jgi:hypothetical protein
MIYGIFLVLHSIVRWLVLPLGLAAVVSALAARSKAAPYTPHHRTLGTLFVSTLHLNVLLGILLYVALSPTTQAGFADFGAAMKNSALRFFLIEHPFGMIVGTVVATIGAVQVKATSDAARKHTRAAAFFGGALVIVLLSVPWPFYPAGRPLFWLPF